MLLGLFSLIVGLLNVLTSLILSTPDWSLVLASLNVIVAALLPIPGFWAAGWTARKGVEIFVGASPVHARAAEPITVDLRGRPASHCR
jgi:hypothetical protein